MSRASLTPLRMIRPGYITRDRLDNVIDTCRIFETSFDFWDGDGDGWRIVKLDTMFDLYAYSSTDTEAPVAFCSWLIKSSSPDIKDNFIEDGVWKSIYQTLSWAKDEFADLVDWLLGLSPAGALHDNADLLRSISSLLFDHVTRQNWKIVNLLLAWGADPHHVGARYGPFKETPLSVSMYTSWDFWGLRNFLHGRGLDVKDFACKELEEGRPLLDDGWQMETLTALLELDFEPDIAPDCLREEEVKCDSCKLVIYGYWSHAAMSYGARVCGTRSCCVVQPYWQVIVEGIKNGISPQRSCSDTQHDQPSNSQHNFTVLDDSSTDTTDDSAFSQDPALCEDEAAHPDQEPPTNGVDISSMVFDRNEIWCIWCWHHFKKTGLRTSATSATEFSDEDDFSPYLIHT